MSLLDFLGLVLAWYASGLLLASMIIAYKWYRGTDISEDEMIGWAALSLLGLGPMLILLLAMVLLGELWTSISKSTAIRSFRLRTVLGGRRK